MKTILAAAGALAMFATAPAFAGTITISGDTTGGPTYNRPIANGDGVPTDLSAVGTDVAYEATEFTVTADGSYDFLSTATGYDNYLGLYSGSFDPSDPLANALIYNDDDPSIGLSGFAYGLTTGTDYFVVASGFENDDFGPYSLSITGPGDIVLAGSAGAVPEPASWALMIAGFGLVGGTLRARRTNIAFA